MSITLNPELEADVRSRVSSGRYADPMDVLNEAMRLLMEHEKLVVLRGLLKEAEDDIARGNVYEWTPDFFEKLIEEADEEDALGLPISDRVKP